MLPEEEATRLVAAFGIAVALFWFTIRLDNRRVRKIISEVLKEMKKQER